jgi:hypothetical protein
MTKDEPIAYTQDLEAHNRKIPAVKPLPAHAQAHRNRKVSAIMPLSAPTPITQSRVKIKDSDEFDGAPCQAHVIEDLSNLG